MISVCACMAATVCAIMSREKQSGSIRLYVDKPLKPGAALDATAGQAHYLGIVMRRTAGDGVRLFNGCDGEFNARIASTRRETVRLVVEDRLRQQDPEPDLWLVFALLKRDATD